MFDFLGNPVPNTTVRLSIDGVEGTAGHAHGGTMPPGDLSLLEVVTGPTGEATVTYTSNIYSGDVELTGTAPNAANALETIEIGIGGLVQLRPSGSIGIIGLQAVHPNHVLGTLNMVARLTRAGSSFHSETGRQMEVNDMSLIRGGMFDAVTPTYDLNESGHQTHRDGRNADIRMNDLLPGQQDMLRLTLETAGATVVLHQPGPHFQVFIP